jgi:hypothetical protein
MKVKIKVEKEVDLKLLIVKARVRYWEDSEVDGENDTENGENIPCKIGDLWCPHIEIETGKILNWKQGVKAEIHYEVADGLGYEIQSENGEVVLSADDGYVPETLAPKEEGYGGCIIMDIDKNGHIANWKFNFSDFESSED